jgi:hypothetical protein
MCQSLDQADTRLHPAVEYQHKTIRLDATADGIFAKVRLVETNIKAPLGVPMSACEQAPSAGCRTGPGRCGGGLETRRH